MITVIKGNFSYRPMHLYIVAHRVLDSPFNDLIPHALIRQPVLTQITIAIKYSAIGVQGAYGTAR